MTDVGDDWQEAVGLTFDEVGTMYVWERGGRVWIVENDVKSATPLIDISEEVGAWRDYGMLGFALDPHFRQNGYIYLMYVVDHHHLANFGTPQYDPVANEYYHATIGRLTRYTARASDGFHSVDPASRTVLVGESISNGFPILNTGHGVGTLVFGTDGTLLASCGDGAQLSDYGSDPTSNFEQGLNEGIIKPKENVGAFRSQMVDSLSGKILRLNPATGEGIPSNPFYDPVNPRAARSRVWALGFRNPFRMTPKPGTGSHVQGDANPGVLFVGDVGYQTWEEITVVSGPGMNAGWPIFEGFTQFPPGFEDANPDNQDAPNPLFGTGGCTQQYFTFRDLLKEATLAPPSWPNPCDTNQQVPNSVPHFLHTRPAIDWKHGGGPSRCGIFTGNNAAVINIGASGSPVSGPQFGGNCSIGGTWYQGEDFPVQYKNTYFHADFGVGWIRNITFDTNNRPVSVGNFGTGADGIVAMATHPISGALYCANVFYGMQKISYGGNAPPKAVATSDVTYGPGPLTVQFTGSGSSDPEGLPLTYRWVFGDGSPSNTQTNPAHVFNAPVGVPTRYNVMLTVTDNAAATNTATLVISPNNTPPSVTIVSPTDGAFYSMTGNTVYPLVATVSDNEHTLGQLAPQWQTVLHHNNHVHPNPVDTNWGTSTVISPLGCDGDTYSYQISLTVTDAAGLSTRREVNLYPDCTTNSAPVFAPVSNVVLNAGQILSFTNSASDVDVPPQVLTFSLLSFPAGANLDATSGLFTWRPSVAQAGLTNLIRIKVDDSGSPILSATQSFTVAVNALAAPGIAQTTWTNNQFQMLITGAAGPDYTVQASADLTGWTNLFTTNSPLLPFIWSDTNAQDFPHRFFRILLEP